MPLQDRVAPAVLLANMCPQLAQEVVRFMAGPAVQLEFPRFDSLEQIGELPTVPWCEIRLAALATNPRDLGWLVFKFDEDKTALA